MLFAHELGARKLGLAFCIGLAQEGQIKAAPVDFRACTFHEGKGMKDLDQLAEKFRAYANEHDFNYAAWALVPEYANAVPYDFGWLGAWPSSGAFGVSMEKWKRDCI